MKKKTIATSLLAILVSTYAAPFVSNAEAIKGATEETTESVAPTTESAAPTTESAAPTTESAAPTTESAAPTTESAAPTTESAAPATKEEAPTTKSEKTPASKEKTNKDFLADYNNAVSTLQYFIENNMISFEVFNNAMVNLSAAENSADITAIMNQVLEQMATDGTPEAALASIKAEALQQITNWLNYGQIDDATYMNAQQAIIAATDAEAVAQAIANVESIIQANTAQTLATIKDDARDQILGWFNEGLLTPNDYAFYLNEINNAANAEAVAAVVANAEQQAQQNGLHVDLDAIKQSAKDQLFNWLSYGQINDNQYINGLNAINNATTADEVNNIIAGIQAEIDGAVAATLEQIKQDAKDQLFAWYNEGLLTAEDYTFYLSEVVSAVDAEAVAAVIANAEQQIQQNGLHNDNPEDVTNNPIVTPSNPEDVTNKPEATPSEDNKAENTLVSKPAGTQQEVKKETVVTKVSKNEVNKQNELPKTGELNQNLTGLGLMSVALGSLVAVFKRKRS
ncbi:LPXTG cell wall anchor domain-containing protein [Vagococcus martis]